MRTFWLISLFLAALLGAMAHGTEVPIEEDETTSSTPVDEDGSCLTSCLQEGDDPMDCSESCTQLARFAPGTVTGKVSLLCRSSR